MAGRGLPLWATYALCGIMGLASAGFTLSSAAEGTESAAAFRHGGRRGECRRVSRSGRPAAAGRLADGARLGMAKSRPLFISCAAEWRSGMLLMTNSRRRRPLSWLRRRRCLSKNRLSQCLAGRGEKMKGILLLVTARAIPSGHSHLALSPAHLARNARHWSSRDFSN